MRTGLLVVGHGSRDGAANAAIQHCAAALRQRHPGLRVAGAFLEFATPTLPEGLASLAAQCATVVALPVFLFAAGHVTRDIPAALAQVQAAFPHVCFRQAPCLRAHPSMVALAWRRIVEALPPHADLARTALVLVGRGAAEPSARADFEALARAVGAVGPASLHVGFVGLATPTVETVLQNVAHLQPERVVVAPYFLFPGRLLTDLRARVAAVAAGHPHLPMHMAACLGAEPELLEALDGRLAAVWQDATATATAHPANIAPAPLR